MPHVAEMPLSLPEQASTQQPPAPAVVPLETLLQSIRLDALLRSDRYLDEVRVPFGGE